MKQIDDPAFGAQQALDNLIKRHTLASEMPSLLLHSCCGPCSSYVLEYLCAHFHITLFYYNPNIQPRDEYLRRLDAQRQLLRDMPTANPVELLEGEYDPDRFLFATRGLENEPEGGKRCAICFQMRLEEAARMAKQHGFDYFSTTLSVSPHKDAGVLASLSQQLAEVHEISALPANFKKKGGYQRSVQLARQYGLYRQSYCGCLFSKNSADHAQ